jgi:hypothetical protein
MDIASHIDRMAETRRRLLQVTVVARDDAWEWQVQSQGTVLISGTGRTVFWLGSWATTQGSACSPRTSTTCEGYTLKEFQGPREKALRLSHVKAMFVEMKDVIG